MMTRHEFLRSMVGASVAGAGVAALAGCGSDGSPPPPDAPRPIDSPPGACTSPNEVIGANHGHTLTVTLADLNAGMDMTYDITGGSAHSHDVTITAAQFAMIKAGMTVSVTSTSGGGHTHGVTITCPS